MRQGNIRIQAALIVLGAIAVFSSARTVTAGPITNGPGVAPFVKLGVYQGVISVVPGGVTDSILEIGNAGRDIASTGSIYLRPGTIGGQGGNVVIGSQASPDEGGEVSLLGAGAYQVWNVDVWRNRFRIHTAGIERMVIDGTAGNIYVPTGSICYGNVGSTNCLTVAGGSGAIPTLDQVLGSGNNSARSAAVGAAVSPASKFVVNNSTSFTGNIDDAISAYANTSASAVYAQQNNVAGYAGYFSGRVNITGDLIYKGRLKPTPGLQVCEISSDTCLGKYLWTLNPNTTTAQYCYYTSPSAGVPATCVNVFSPTSVPTCSSGVLRQRSPSGSSYWISDSACTPGNGEYMTAADVSAGTPPAGIASQYACIDTVTNYGNLVMIASKTPATGGGCAAFNQAINTARRVTVAGNSTLNTLQYELR